MFFGKQNSELDKFADILEKALIALFTERGDITFSSSIKKERKKIIEYAGRMRADGMEKFNNEPTYVSAVNYYALPKDMKKEKALGALILYVEQSYGAQIMKLLRYPPVDDENEDALLDSCGTLCNLLAGRFKSEISYAGYIELEMSPFITYRNSAVAGVKFCFNEFDMYTETCYIDGKKRLVMEMTMGAIPRR